MNLLIINRTAPHILRLHCLFIKLRKQIQKRGGFLCLKSPAQYMHKYAQNMVTVPAFLGKYCVLPTQ